MKKKEKKEYWICIIGATDRNKLDDGADAPMRIAVQEAYKETTGRKNDTCWSGWGTEREKVDIINAVWLMDKTNPLYKSLIIYAKERGILTTKDK